MNTARRERLKLVVSEQAETETIERILRTRLRERREIRGARDRRQVHHAEEEKWIAPELASKGHPYDLETALKTGQVRCRLWHRSRWWVWKEATPREAIRIGSDGRSLVDSGHWELRVNKDDWHAYLGKPAASTPSADMTSIATDTATDPVEPSPPSMEQPSQRAVGTAALAAPSTSKRKRAKVAAQPATYANHVAEHLERTGEYPSETDDKTWAETHGYVQKHITRVLRPQYRDGLAEPEQLKFQDKNKGKHRPNKDWCP